MKTLLLSLFSAVLFLGACNSTNTSEQATQDSINEAAAADSMLNAALEADTLLSDTGMTDSVR